MKIYFVTLALLLFTYNCTVPAYAADEQPALPDEQPVLSTGDRVAINIKDLERNDGGSIAVSIDEDYVLGTGDVLNVVVEGKANLNYHVNATVVDGAIAPGSSPDETTVRPDGKITLPIVGSIQASGKTVAELQEAVRKALSEYFINFEARVTVSRPRMMKIFVNGSVHKPGPQVVSGSTTVIEALLSAGIDPTGSTRRVELRSGGSSSVIDVYSIAVQGHIERNVVLEPGDALYVPPLTQWVEVNGEVGRQGRFEMLSGMKLKDILDLAMGLTPAAASSKISVERSGPDGTALVLSADGAKACADPACKDNITLASGDKLRVPSLTEYMPMVRMVGEFVGEGVFQRTMGQGVDQVLNKSGVYLLAQGKTVGELIRETGGVTPQADLKNARIKRMGSDGNQEIPLDMERLLLQNDSSVDIALKPGDMIVLPALADKVHVFGAVARPGSRPYTPNRKLLDYIGDAGGQTAVGRLSHVRVIRGDAKSPVIMNCDLTKGVKGSVKDNPNLEPGDVVFVADRSFNGWRDTISIITTFRLLQTIID